MVSHGDERVVGDFSVGAYGPTILLKLASPAAAKWLRDVLFAMAKGRQPLDLAQRQNVAITNVTSLELRTVAAAEQPCRLRRLERDSRFVWECTSDGWQDLAILIEPFAAGERGHQYLTSEATDAALVEVSHGEPDVVVPGHPAEEPG